MRCDVAMIVVATKALYAVLLTAGDIVSRNNFQWKHPIPRHSIHSLPCRFLLNRMTAPDREEMTMKA
jgi:hypothetical protein